MIAALHTIELNDGEFELVQRALATMHTNISETLNSQLALHNMTLDEIVEMMDDIEAVETLQSRIRKEINERAGDVAPTANV